MIDLIKEMQNCWEVSDNGKLIWQRDAAYGVDEGDEAGYLNKEGHYRVQLGGLEYQGARVIWAISHGKWPTGRLHYRDGNRSNTKLTNLEIRT